MSALQTGALLQGGKYKIEKSLGQGGFGITYLAEQTNLGRKVCIKEFFMKEYGERTESSDADSDATVLTGVSAVTSAAAEIMGRYREKFVKEARTIAKLDHPGIVRIHDVFEENGTAYYVMDFIEGENLNDLVKREGALPEERALGYIRQVADALSYVHGHNIMHLDVKPANIIVRKSDDKAILIDFGTAKQYDSEGTQTSTTPVGLSAGYAPIEMNNPGGVQTFSPETDVYSLGATLYYLITGKNPPSASERMEMIMDGEKFQLPETLSSTTANVIEQSMQARKKRIQTVSSFLDLLDTDQEKERLEAERKAAAEVEAKRQEELRLEQEKAEAEKKRIAEEEAKRKVGAEQKRLAEEKARKEAAENTEKERIQKKKISAWIIGGIAAVCILGIIFFIARPKGSVNNDSSIANLHPDVVHEWVDLGLSVKWATCNLGANSPEEVGDYLSWYEPLPKNEYSEENHVVDVLLGDVANHHWGGEWRVPSKEEFQELLDKCEVRWTTKSGMPGIECIGTNKNSIFLPAAGFKSHFDLTNLGSFGCYWSDTRFDDSFEYCLIFYEPKHASVLGYNADISSFAQYLGCVIRPVIE